MKSPWVIAELSGNHNGKLSRCLDMMTEAADAGADAIKFQAFDPTLMPDYVGNEATYAQTTTPREWYDDLFDHSSKLGVMLFASVFSPNDISILCDYDCPIYKIASPESTRLPSMEYFGIARAVRQTGKPLMVSSGRKDLGMMMGLNPDYLLFCVAGYPATILDDDLDYFVSIREWPKQIGFSDHTTGLMAPLAFLGAGATIIEKHFKLDNDCWDTKFAFNPAQFADLCAAVHK